MQSSVSTYPPFSILSESASDSSIWTLTRGSTSEADQQVVVRPVPFTVGRRPGSSLQINSRTISGIHATLTIQGDDLLVEDNGSTNGTYVNGNRISALTRLQEEDLLQFADMPFRVRSTRRATTCHTQAGDMCDQALALVQFDRLMQNRLVSPFYQPIVDIRTGRFLGYEVLARSRLYGLESCQAMFDAASRLNMEVELSRMLRWEGVRQAMTLPAGMKIFLNTHPLEIDQEGLVDSMATARRLSAEIPLILEVHEASVTDPAAMRELRAQLKDLEIGIAYDDFGAGQTRLSELIEAPPDYLKFDMSLIRGIDKATPERQKMLGSLVQIVIDLGVNPLAEGIETPEEADVCRNLGFQSAQGFHFGRPAPIPGQ